MLAAYLSGLDLVALMIDGVHFGEHLFVWAGPYPDEQQTHYAARVLFAADALLLARRTYDGLSAVIRPRLKTLARPTSSSIG